MGIGIFLSYPKTHTQKQSAFIEQLATYLRARGFEPRTLGVNEYDMDAPLTAIRRLMLESNGLITVALRRLWVQTGIWKKGANVDWAKEAPTTDVWYTSPYCQIEPAMAYQLGLPILVLRENGVLAEGLLEKGVVGTYMPEFSLEGEPGSYLQSPEFAALIGKWEGFVRAVVDGKGKPPKWF